MKYLLLVCAFFWHLIGIVFGAPEKSKVIELLEGRHWKLDIVSFQLLGDDTDKVLIEIGGDTSVINYIRFRAIEALSLFPTENTAVFLESSAETSFAPLARRGFEALKNGFYKTHPNRVKSLAGRLLKHKNAQVRISAARFIRSIDVPEFKRFLKTEKYSWVRKAAQN